MTNPHETRLSTTERDAKKKCVKRCSQSAHVSLCVLQCCAEGAVLFPDGGVLYSCSLVSDEESRLCGGQSRAAMPRKLAEKCCGTRLLLSRRECVLVTQPVCLPASSFRLLSTSHKSPPTFLPSFLPSFYFIYFFLLRVRILQPSEPPTCGSDKARCNSTCSRGELISAVGIPNVSRDNWAVAHF